MDQQGRWPQQCRQEPFLALVTSHLEQVLEAGLLGALLASQVCLAAAHILQLIIAVAYAKYAVMTLSPSPDQPVFPSLLRKSTSSVVCTSDG